MGLKFYLVRNPGFCAAMMNLKLGGFSRGSHIHRAEPEQCVSMGAAYDSVSGKCSASEKIFDHLWFRECTERL